MISSALITILTAGGTLLLLLNVLMTKSYSDSPPQGSDAMGLLLPIATSAIGSLALLLATAICIARGGFAWINTSPTVAGSIAAVGAIGVVLAACGVFLAWAERGMPWIVPAGLLGGGVGPIALATILLASAWMTPESLNRAGFPRVVGGFAGVAALLGFALGIGGLYLHLHQRARARAETAQAILAQHQKDEAERRRVATLSPADRLRETWANFSPDTPLWYFTAALPDNESDEVRDLSIQRALRVPNFDHALACTLTDSHPRFRHGVLLFIVHVPAEHLKTEWRTPLRTAISTTAGQIRAKPAWLTPDSFANPHPIDHLCAIADAAARLGGGPDLEAAINDLRTAISDLPEGANRTRALDALTTRNAPPALATPPAALPRSAP